MERLLPARWIMRKAGNRGKLSQDHKIRTAAAHEDACTAFGAEKASSSHRHAEMKGRPRDCGMEVHDASIRYANNPDVASFHDGHGPALASMPRRDDFGSSPDPFGDFAMLIKDRNCTGENPSERAVNAYDTMLKLEY